MGSLLSRRFWLQAGLGAAMTLLFIGWVGGQWGGARATALFSDVASTLVPLGAAYACAMRAREGKALRAAWAGLAAGCASWALGQGYWAVFEFLHGAPPATPSLADVGYLGFIPLAVWGLLHFVESRGQPTGYLGVGLDAALIGSSFIFIAFVLGLERILLESRQTDLPRVVNLLYPFGDAGLLAVALVRLSRAPARGSRPLGLLAAGMVFLTIADTWFLIVDAQGTYATGGILDAFWIIGFQLIGLAAVRPDTLEAPLAAPRQTRARAVVPLLPFLVAAGAAVYAELRDGALSVTLFWTALVVILVVVARLLVMVLDSVLLTRQAEAAAEALRAEQAYRTKMLNSITHDLMNPLSPVALQLKILERPGLQMDAPVAHALDVIRRNVKQVTRLASDLKDLANVQAGHLRLDLADTDAAALARQAVDSFAQAAQERGVALAADLDGPVPLRADPTRVTQVLYNLVSNALKFTPSGKAVTVALRRDGADAVFTVRDEGRGLEPGEQARLFQPFSQVHDRSQQDIADRGTGLGLYIAKQIVGQHGGRISVASPGRDKGSTFTVELPLMGAAPSPLEPANAPPA